MRNQMKLIKAGSKRRDEQEIGDQINSLDKDLKELNFNVKNIKSGQES